MIFSIVAALLIFWMIINFPEIFWAIIGWILLIAILLAVLIILALTYKFADIETIKTIGVVAGILFLISLVLNVISRTFDGILGLWEKFYDLKTILKALAIQFINPGITDKQKIVKIKKINELALYGKESHKIANQRREEKAKEAENLRLHKLFLKCNKDFDKVANLIDKELSEFLNSKYINIDFVEPTKENMNGFIHINTQKHNSIIKIICRAAITTNNDNFKTYKIRINEDFRGEIPSNDYSSNDYKSIAKKAKKTLLKYFKLYPNELNSVD